ncbi:MAG: hypothetical protein KME26_24870 [Oscillatoria princeps RMCB-10]|jgi:hypothetical protein|nr:hypothetical protein [Oscillatoria princeps RMCB-10]
MLFPSQTVSETNAFDTPSNRHCPPTSAGFPSDMLLSLATVPVLLGLWGGKALTALMRDIGEASEEVFRGQRLPVLNFPTAPAAGEQTSDSD